MLYYSNGGPGPASKLLRVNASGSGSFKDWRWHSKGERWSPAEGGHWFDYPDAQDEILNTGEMFMVDTRRVPEIQAQMKEQFDRYAKRE